MLVGAYPKIYRTIYPAIKELENYKNDEDEIYLPINLYTLKLQSNCFIFSLHYSYLLTENLFTLYSYAILWNFNLYLKRQLLYILFFSFMKNQKAFIYTSFNCIISRVAQSVITSETIWLVPIQ